MAKYDKGNHVEIPDNTPVELPIGYTHPETLEQVIARMISASDFRKQQEAAGMESFDEADDFEVEDDSEFVSDHEMSGMQEEFVARSENDRERVERGRDEDAEQGSEVKPKRRERKPKVKEKVAPGEEHDQVAET